MSFLTVAAVVGAVGTGVSMYNQYKQGRTLEGTDWKGMIGDIDDSFKENIGALRDRAETAFDKVGTQFDIGMKQFGEKATSLADYVGENLGGFAQSGGAIFEKGQELLNINREQGNAMSMREIQERGIQQETDQQEFDMFEQKENQIAELQTEQDLSERWYPGKNLGKAFRKLTGG